MRFIISSANEASQWCFPKLLVALKGLLRKILSMEEGTQKAWTASQCWYVGPIRTDAVTMQMHDAPAAAPPHTGAPPCLRPAVMSLGQLQCIRSDQGSGKVWDVFHPSKHISTCSANGDVFCELPVVELGDEGFSHMLPLQPRSYFITWIEMLHP